MGRADPATRAVKLEPRMIASIFVFKDDLGVLWVSLRTLVRREVLASQWPNWPPFKTRRIGYHLRSTWTPFKTRRIEHH